MAQFTPRGRQLLATVLELAERDRGRVRAMLLGVEDELDRMRAALLQLADRNRIPEGRPAPAIDDGERGKLRVGSQGV